MAKNTSPLLPSTQNLLEQLGERLGLARRRRKLTAAQVAERAGMAPLTLRNVEAGKPGVVIGSYLSVMQALGLEGDLALVGKEDPLGRQLQDMGLSARAGASVRVRADLSSSGPPLPPWGTEQTAQARKPAAAPPSLNVGSKGFVTTSDLSALLKPMARRPGKKKG